MKKYLTLDNAVASGIALSAGELGFGIARGNLGLIFIGAFFGILLTGALGFMRYREQHPSE